MARRLKIPGIFYFTGGLKMALSKWPEFFTIAGTCNFICLKTTGNKTRTADPHNMPTPA